MYFVYMLASHREGTLYVGVTNDLARRMNEHKSGLIQGFVQKYGTRMFVYVESFDTARAAIEREKQIKGGSRKKKIILIETMNSTWTDLSNEIS